MLNFMTIYFYHINNFKNYIIFFIKFNRVHDTLCLGTKMDLIIYYCFKSFCKINYNLEIMLKTKLCFHLLLRLHSHI